jgi:hypothetical protein
MHEAAESRQVGAVSPLTAEQVAEFSREGFIALDSPQISQAEIHWCRDILMSLIARNVGRKEGRLFDISAKEGGDESVTPQLFRPSLYATESSGLTAIRDLLSPSSCSVPTRHCQPIMPYSNPVVSGVSRRGTKMRRITIRNFTRNRSRSGLPCLTRRPSTARWPSFPGRINLQSCHIGSMAAPRWPIPLSAAGSLTAPPPSCAQSLRAGSLSITAVPSMARRAT